MNMLLRIIESVKSVFIFQFSSLNKICYTNLNHLLYTLIVVVFNLSIFNHLLYTLIVVVFNLSKFSLYSTSGISTPCIPSVEY